MFIVKVVVDGEDELRDETDVFAVKVVVDDEDELRDEMDEVGR